MDDDFAYTQGLVQKTFSEHTAANAAVAAATEKANAQKKAASEQLAAQLRTRYQNTVVRTVSTPSYRSCLVPLSVLLMATAITFAILYGWAKWPSITEGCQPYNCSYAPDWEFSGCVNASDPSTCQYFWDAIVDGVSSFWHVGMYEVDCCDGCTGGGCAQDGFFTNSTAYPPYPNGTLCYRPPTCQPYPGQFWIQGWNCIPVFNCTNTERYDGRLAFVYTTSILSGLALLAICVCWMCAQARPDSTTEERRPITTKNIQGEVA